MGIVGIMITMIIILDVNMRRQPVRAMVTNIMSKVVIKGKMPDQVEETIIKANI